MSVFAYIKQHSAWSSYDEVFDSNLISSKNLTKLFKLYIYLYLDIDSEEISITRTSGVAKIKELFEENLCWITKRLTRIFFFVCQETEKKNESVLSTSKDQTYLQCVHNMNDKITLL